MLTVIVVGRRVVGYCKIYFVEYGGKPLKFVLEMYKVTTYYSAECVTDSG